MEPIGFSMTIQLLGDRFVEDNEISIVDSSKKGLED